MKAMRFRAWAAINKDGQIKLPLYGTLPLFSPRGAACDYLIMNEVGTNPVEVNVTITAAKPAKAKRAKRGRK